MQEKFNILVNLNDKEWKECRKIIIDVILGTDMSHHFEQIKKTQVVLLCTKNRSNGSDLYIKQLYQISISYI